MSSSSKSSRQPSSNWLALQKSLPFRSKRTTTEASTLPRKRRKTEHVNEISSSNTTVDAAAGQSFARGPLAGPSTFLMEESRNGESLSALRIMISGELEYSPAQQQPGKYLALDCEMVGVGPEGKESSLARVSLVNFYGAVQLDVFVRQRERVVDYRTEFSGVRASDMVNARPFIEVQKQVAELLKDRILVGHAVHNDLKALLLSHPRQQTRDTQIYAFKHKVTRTRRPALRHLVKQELGVTIQVGEHSSVTDARATMALYRLHRKEWDKGQRPDGPGLSGKASAQKRKTAIEEEKEHPRTDSTDAPSGGAFPGGGRRGVSSGLSTVIKRREPAVKDNWWANLNDGSSKISAQSRARR